MFETCFGFQKMKMSILRTLEAGLSGRGMLTKVLLKELVGVAQLVTDPPQNPPVPTTFEQIMKS